MNNLGVLLVNVGSPRSPAIPDIRRFLREFLMDKYVLDLPWLLRFCLVHFIIVPSRARQLADTYRKIWLAAGSPLVVTSLKLKTALQAALGVPVEFGLRYGEPSISAALHKLIATGASRLLLMPLFPQYATATYETAVMYTKKLIQRVIPTVELTVHPPFYVHPDYVNALVAVTRNHLPSEFDHLLFSFHSLPERHLRKADPTRTHCLTKPNCCAVPSLAHKTCYKHQCIQTMQAVVKALGVGQEKYSLAFQSQFGPGRWLGPNTFVQLRALAHAGVKNVAVICPSFVTDCIETIDEITLRAHAVFRAAGGQQFTFIPCLNDHPAWVQALTVMVKQMFAQLNR